MARVARYSVAGGHEPVVVAAAVIDAVGWTDRLCALVQAVVAFQTAALEARRFTEPLVLISLISNLERLIRVLQRFPLGRRLFAVFLAALTAALIILRSLLNFERHMLELDSTLPPVRNLCDNALLSLTGDT